MTPGPRRMPLALLPGAIAVGLLAGAVGVGFQLALDRAADVRRAVERAGIAPGWQLAASMAFSAAAVAAGVYLVRRFAPEAAGSGIPRVEAVLHRGGDLSWPRELWVKFAGGVLAIGGGLALGREGPTVHLGAAIGRAVSGPPDEGHALRRRTLIAVGAGAGLAAAFNAPVAGAVFVLEELRAARSPRGALAALLAAVAADGVCRGLLGARPVFGFVALEVPALSALPVFLAAGAAAGALGVAFNAGLLGALRAFDRIRATGIGRRAAPGLLLGAAVGAAGWLVPELLGSGEPLVRTGLSSEPAARAIAIVLAARFAMTIASYGSGAAGGLFAPLLVLGCGTGLLVFLGARGTFPGMPVDSAAVAIVAMAGIFAAAVRAPATGILLMLEMTGAFLLILPLACGVLAAVAVARAAGAVPVYEALLARDAARDPDGKRAKEET